MLRRFSKSQASVSYDSVSSLIGSGLGLGAQTGSPESKAEEIGHVMMQAMGGQDAWSQARFVRFDFRVNIGGKIVANRSHFWDKLTGRYRIEDKTKEGLSRVVLFNVGTQQGSAYVDEKRLDGQAATTALKEAYGCVHQRSLLAGDAMEMDGFRGPIEISGKDTQGSRGI